MRAFFASNSWNLARTLGKRPRWPGVWLEAQGTCAASRLKELPPRASGSREKAIPGSARPRRDCVDQLSGYDLRWQGLSYGPAAMVQAALGPSGCFAEAERAGAWFFNKRCAAPAGAPPSPNKWRSTFKTHAPLYTLSTCAAATTESGSQTLGGGDSENAPGLVARLGKSAREALPRQRREARFRQPWKPSARPRRARWACAQQRAELRSGQRRLRVAFPPRPSPVRVGPVCAASVQARRLPPRPYNVVGTKRATVETLQRGAGIQEREGSSRTPGGSAPAALHNSFLTKLIRMPACWANVHRPLACEKTAQAGPGQVVWHLRFVGASAKSWS